MHIRVIGILLLACLTFPALAQTSAIAELRRNLEASKDGKQRVDILNQLAQLEYNRSSSIGAARYSIQAYRLADKIEYLAGKASSSLIQGDLARGRGYYTDALKFYVSAVRTFERLGDNPQTARGYESLGMLYQNRSYYKLALDNYEKALKLNKGVLENGKMLSLLQNMAFCHTEEGNYEIATKYYNTLLTEYEIQGKAAGRLNVLNELARVSQLGGKYSQAKEYYKLLAETYQTEQKGVELAKTYNTLGFLSKSTDEPQMANSYFTKVIATYKKNKDKYEGEAKAILLVNTGVAYTNLRQYSKAKAYYEEALKVRKLKNNPSQLADTYNYIATNHYLSGNYSAASENANTAVQIAERNGVKETLPLSYKLLSLLHQQAKKTKEEQSYKERFTALQDEVRYIQEQRRQSLLAQQTQIEKEENDFRALLAQQERHNSEMQQLALEAQQKEQELALLKKTQELQAERLLNQQLEQERINQLLAITKQQSQAEKQRQEIEILQKSKEIQALALKQNEIREQERLRKIELLEKDQKLKEEQLAREEEKLAKEATYRKLGYAVIGFIIVILGIVAYALAYTRKKNRKIQTQKKEIEAQNDDILQKNEELQHKQEEIQIQKEYLEEANVRLSESNRVIQQSINAGLTIQRAILPDDRNLAQVFKEHFVLFKPKDVVSGDFYWMEDAGDSTFIAVIDCTGHGVPGAFMSMIGKTLLDKLLLLKKSPSPAKLLDNLHEEVEQVLRQQDSDNRDGMDICLVEIKREVANSRQVTFVGAKRPLYIYRKAQRTIEQIKGDRKSIGGIRLDQTPFTNQQLFLQPDDVLYLTSDGYIDQSDKDRKKFGNTQFVELLQEVATEPLRIQKKILEKALTDHQQDTLQRDDILIVGVKA
ncbi:MAG: SpoIIE family protein phosphatase [Thermonemataceae bacterium]